jgi:tetratricopeptide (TPR) repeat protein
MNRGLTVALVVLLGSLAPACSSHDATPAGGQEPAAVGALPAAPASANPAPAPAVKPEFIAYLDGLDRLFQGAWSDAVTAFSKALDASGDDATIVLARGVAETLAEQFQPALSDLRRARTLGLKGREAELWIYSAEAMSGIVGPEHALGGGQESLVSIPGHIAQGGQDYTSEYGSYIAYDLANAYQRLRLPPDRGGAGTPDAVKSPAMRAAMTKAGQWFANRWMRRADLAPAHLARARQLHDRGQYEAALREVDFAKTAYPADPDVRYYEADSWLALGRPATARRAFTIALTYRTDFGYAYLGRAAAEAALGDRTHAMADLAQAQRFDPASTARLRDGIEAEAGKQHVDASPDALVAELDSAARANKSDDELIAAATRVQRAIGERRLRYDEIYQDRLRTLEDDVRAHASKPDPIVSLAKYIIDEADNRGEKVEPRRELVPYRFQVSREQELTRAIELADRALGLDAKHVGAMIQKALALTALKRYDEADALADRALALAGGNNADALRLYAKFKAMRANQMSAEASSLRQDRCSSSSHDEDHGDYIRHVTTTTCYPPT